MKPINENTKVTLTLGQLKRLVKESRNDESALGDAFKSIGTGILNILKTTLKGVVVVIAGLGGSFLFGLPGLLLAVCIAFGLMSAKEGTTVKVDEAMLDGVKDKLKTVIDIFKADKKKAKEINDKVLAAKKSGDQEAIQAAADEIRAMANKERTNEEEASEEEIIDYINTMAPKVDYNQIVDDLMEMFGITHDQAEHYIQVANEKPMLEDDGDASPHRCRVCQRYGF